MESELSKKSTELSNKAKDVDDMTELMMKAKTEAGQLKLQVSLSFVEALGLTHETT